MDKQLNNKNKEGVVKVWLGDDGIVHVYMAGRIGEKEVREFIEEKTKVLQGIQGKTRTFGDLTELIMSDFSLASKIKGLMVKDLKKLEQEKVEKMALAGKSIILKVIGSFLGKALGIKETKYFTDKEEALKWLKEE